MHICIFLFIESYKSMHTCHDVSFIGQKAVVDENIAGSGQISEVKMEYNNSMMKLAAPALVNVFDLRSFTAICDLAG